MLRGLKNLLEPEFEVVAMADNALSCADAMRVHQPALAVVEIALTTPGSASLARHLASRNPGTRVVVLGPGDEPEIVKTLLDDGCAGFVVASRATRDLIPALRAALEGEIFVSDPDSDSAS